MDPEFYIIYGNKVKGPFSLMQTLHFVKTGQITRETKVLLRGQTEWKNAGSVPELYPPNLEPKAKAKPTPKAVPVSIPKAVPKAVPISKPKAEPKAEPEPELEIESELEPELEIESELEPELEIESESEPELELELEIESELEPEQDGSVNEDASSSSGKKRTLPTATVVTVAKAPKSDVKKPKQTAKKDTSKKGTDISLLKSKRMGKSSSSRSFDSFEGSVDDGDYGISRSSGSSYRRQRSNSSNLAVPILVGVVLLAVVVGLLSSGKTTKTRVHKFKDGKGKTHTVVVESKTKEELKKEAHEVYNQLNQEGDELSDEIASAKKERSKVSQSVAQDKVRSRGTVAGERMVRVVNGVEFAFRWCPAGKFTMGSPENEKGRRDNETQHQVTFDEGFWMLETEVTVDMLRSIDPTFKYGQDVDMKAALDMTKKEYGNQIVQDVKKYNDIYQKNMGEMPVPVILLKPDCWNKMQEFCKKLGEALNMEVSLPTEAEWEYACRAGSSGPYAGNLKDMAWCKETIPNEEMGKIFMGAHRGAFVGQKKPNAWGLYDMHGGVYEICLDRLDGKQENAESKDSELKNSEPEDSQRKNPKPDDTISDEEGAQYMDVEDDVSDSQMDEEDSQDEKADNSQKDSQRDLRRKSRRDSRKKLLKNSQEKSQDDTQEDSQEETQDDSLDDSQEETREESRKESQDDVLDDSLDDSQEESRKESLRDSQEDVQDDVLDENLEDLPEENPEDTQEENPEEPMEEEQEFNLDDHLPPGLEEYSYHVTRGGGWLSPADRCRSAYRTSAAAALQEMTLGFRVVAKEKQNASK